MKKINWDNYKFHCSALPTLMTEGRTKGELSETTKSALLEIWIEEVFGRKKIIDNKYMTKGTVVESDSLELVSKVTGRPLFKNKTTYENEWLVGTPDVVSPLIDIKSSWDIWTFFAQDEKKANKAYYWQLAGYGQLTGGSEAELIFTLVTTPEEIINDELYKLQFKVGEDRAQEARVNFEFEDIDPKLRMKTFKFEFSLEDFDKMISKEREWREYLATLDKEIK